LNREDKEIMNSIFKMEKKLPAMTNKKHETTLRITFNRRLSMEGKPVYFLVFSGLIGYYEC
jgi:hypothetical protein